MRLRMRLAWRLAAPIVPRGTLTQLLTLKFYQNEKD